MVEEAWEQCSTTAIRQRENPAVGAGFCMAPFVLWAGPHALPHCFCWDGGQASAPPRTCSRVSSPGSTAAYDTGQPRCKPFDPLSPIRPSRHKAGLCKLPAITPSLEAHQFQIVRQAQWSPRLDWFVDNGGYALYTPKLRTGLQIYHRNGETLFAAAYPQRVYSDFNVCLPLVASSLLFIEDRNLLDTQYPLHDPAVAWAASSSPGGRIAGLINHSWQRGGAITWRPRL